MPAAMAPRMTGLTAGLGCGRARAGGAQAGTARTAEEEGGGARSSRSSAPLREGGGRWWPCGSSPWRPEEATASVRARAEQRAAAACEQGAERRRAGELRQRERGGEKQTERGGSGRRRSSGSRRSPRVRRGCSRAPARPPLPKPMAAGRKRREGGRRRGWLRAAREEGGGGCARRRRRHGSGRACLRRWPCARAAAAGSARARRHPAPLPPEGTGRLAAGAGREGWGSSPQGERGDEGREGRAPARRRGRRRRESRGRRRLEGGGGVMDRGPTCKDPHHRTVNLPRQLLGYGVAELDLDDTLE